MAKILVADDNSNIQKMVGLALKDQGIDVVAVGNGEAAVRKISDVRPDLVLADVFMPVRNGYEVCQYVKTDSALSHIPVILLVGAFDPLDEQEAQRVGADGVLKKPFIPPEPLISMVKSALQRAGVVHEVPATRKAPEAEATRIPEMLKPVGADMPMVGALASPSLHEGNATTIEDQSFVDEVPVPPAPVRIDSGSQPVAFGSLLESPTQEAEEEESFVSQAAPEFVMERDWHAEEEVAEEEEEEPAAWRPEGQDQEDEAPTEKIGKSKGNSGASNWRAGGFEQIAANKSRHTWEPEEETPELVATAPAASNRVEPPATPPAVQEVSPAPANSLVTESWPSAAASVPSEKSSMKSVTAVEEKVPSAIPATLTPEKKESVPANDSWFSVSSSPWDAEIQKASQLASTWDVPAIVAEPTAPPVTAEKPIEAVSHKTKPVIEEAAPPPAVEEVIREEAVQATVDALRTKAPDVSNGARLVPRTEAIEETKEAATPDTDDLVAKILAKMSPEVLQAVTREILKPVVEAMVKDELKSKKS